MTAFANAWAAVQMLAPAPDAFLPFVLAAAALAALDARQRPGDQLGLGAGLDAACLLLLGPFAAAMCGVIGITAQFAFRGRGCRIQIEHATLLVSRLGALTLGGLANNWLIVNGTGGVPVRTAFVCLAVTTVAFVLSRLTVGELTGVGRLRRTGMELLQNWPYVAAEASCAWLLCVVFGDLGLWGVGLVVVLLLLVGQSFSLLGGAKEAYRATLQVVAAAAESSEGGRPGHAANTAAIAQMLIRGCGYSGEEQDTVVYSALLHDIGRMTEMGEDLSTCASITKEIDHLREVTAVVSLCEGAVPWLAPTEQQVRDAFAVALAGDIDDLTTEASHPGGTHLASLRIRIPSETKSILIAEALRQGYPIPGLP